jgi:hypothetical protein
MVAMRGSGKIRPSHIVAFQFFMHSPPGPRSLLIGGLRLVGSASGRAEYKGIVDAFGQFTRADWPGKVGEASELGQQRKAEEAELAASPGPPDRDEFGGWTKGPTMDATGYFSTAKARGRWWLVSPSGHLFLSFGIDAIRMGEPTIVRPRSEMFAWLPASGEPLAKHYSKVSSVLRSLLL